MFSCLISDILSTFTECECIILGDVTYGACCVDDITSKELGADFLIHYGLLTNNSFFIFKFDLLGHSCLVPINETCTKTLYVFVEINIDMKHFMETVELNFPEKD